MTKARDLMTTDFACATPETSAREAARMMMERDCGCLPVVESRHSNRLLGVVTDRDITLRAVAQGGSPDTPVRELMTTEVVTCTPDDEIEQIERAMSESQVRRVPIIENGDRCVGIISQADLALADGAISDDAVGQVVERISSPSRRQH